ncbi:MAG: hypothetical protein CO113_19515 [Elusimicrobia bacterium CG_4_9_14_3_um_filter_62_55]|nr:MAG: hypothetical protein COR54_19980 [Elusimicrobia bacterium CG22_combo_CG10-13_8_21_14_all_63_91]PJA14396.1 MAG: hypothetical protein COX66_12585 [Elusimicrobia bacterium CG_4_10_14_0_2_um_filter_63_34]PJB23040.1 MAG: hypothetical protein CO113_19515 [Elusimicrobia bacterium CG_4_9_14_3_um_filter_62_55]
MFASSDGLGNRLKPGAIFKRDYEYVRGGTANVFCAVEPKAGKYFTRVTKNRKGPAFAKMIARIARAYPGKKTIHLVMDNLSTHSEKSLTDFYGEKLGGKIWDKFTPHYTPKHASWLDQAEIEIGIFSRQCLGHDRIGDIPSLRKRASAWNCRMNRQRRKINWSFTVPDAREKLRYKSADFIRSRY